VPESGLLGSVRGAVGNDRPYRERTSENEVAKKAELFQPERDRKINSVVNVPLGPFSTRSVIVANDWGPVVTPVRYAFRSFDRQWVIPDHRLISMARPALWEGYSVKQVYLTAPEDRTQECGAAFTITHLIPDKHHYHGRGGRVYPLWRNVEATIPNVKAGLLAHLSTIYGREVTPEDMMAYLAAAIAHPAFTARFQKDLIRPGLRVPLTADAALFARAVTVGGEVVWLHTYGERFADPSAGRPFGAPRLPKDRTPSIPKEGAIPGTPEPLPDTMTYDAAAQRLFIGKGYVENVPPEVWGYEVSGMNVLRQWFSYRRRDRRRPIIGDRRPPSPLSFIQPDHWLAEYTDDLIDLLHVLGGLVALEPAQKALLDEILAGKLIDRAALEAEGVFASAQTTDA